MRQANPQPLDPEEYERGYRERMQGEPLTIFSDWTSVSWRAGWSDAGKDQAAEPDLESEPSPTSPLNLKGK